MKLLYFSSLFKKILFNLTAVGKAKLSVVLRKLVAWPRLLILVLKSRTQLTDALKDKKAL